MASRHSSVKWIRKKVFLKALKSCTFKDDYLLLMAFKSEFKKQKKFSWHFVEPPPPLKVSRIIWMAPKIIYSYEN